jgi:uncharacterized protein YkwD
MKRLSRGFSKRSVVMATSVMVLAPMGYATADAGRLDQHAGGTQPAARVGNAKSTEDPPVPPTPSPSSVPVFAAEVQNVLDLVNVERTSRGLGPLKLNVKLNEAARLHSADQAFHGRIFHDSPSGTGPGQRIALQGYEFSTWGENVAAGFRVPKSVMAAWMASPGHCRNILNPAFTELGVGFVNKPDDPARYRDYWTQEFGRPAGATPPGGTYNPAWC